MRRRETLIIWQKQISITERQIMKKTKPKMEVVYLLTYNVYYFDVLMIYRVKYLKTGMIRSYFKIQTPQNRNL